MSDKISDIAFPDLTTPDPASMSENEKQFFSYAVQMEAPKWLSINVRILNVAASTNKLDKLDKAVVLPGQRVIVRGEDAFITRSNAPVDLSPARSTVYLHSFEKFSDIDHSRTNVGRTGAIVYTKQGKAYLRATSPDQKFLYEVDLGDDVPHTLTEHVAEFLSDASKNGKLKLSPREVSESAADAIAVYYAHLEGFKGAPIPEKNRIAPPELMDIEVIDLTRANEYLHHATATAIENGTGFIVNEVNLDELIGLTDRIDQPFRPVAPEHHSKTAIGMK